MSHPWPEGIPFVRREIERLDRACPVCGRHMHLCDHRSRRLFTLAGPLELLCKLAHCPDPACPGRPKTYGPEAELGIAPPRSRVAWDVFAWIGLRRFGDHWSVPEIRRELRQRHAIALSADYLEDAVERYQVMVAARQSDPVLLDAVYADAEHVDLSIDGIQPEKGHEVLYVVRELGKNRVWFAEALLSSSAAEVRRLLEKARDWAARLGKPVRVWVSDKQDAFVSGIAAVFPGVAHRLCRNHFLRDLARPVREADSAAKVAMRKKVRGLRDIEKRVVPDRAAQETSPPQTSAQAAPAPDTSAQDPSAQDTSAPEATAQAAAQDTAAPDTAAPDTSATRLSAPAAAVVLGYCEAVRGILNDDQGGPLDPPGLKMAEALTEVRGSVQRNLDAKKGAQRKRS